MILYQAYSKQFPFPILSVVLQLPQGRCYILNFQDKHSKDRNMFFWMQEPKTDRDDDLCRQVNAALGGQALDSPGEQHI